MVRKLLRAVCVTVIAAGGLIVTAPREARAEASCQWCYDEGFVPVGNTICQCHEEPIKWCEWVNSQNTCPQT